MSIRRRQSSRATNNFIKDALKSGQYPSYETIMYKLYKWQQKHTPGTPSLVLRLVQSHGKSSSNNYNQCMEEVQQDLQDIFDETKDQANRMMTNFDYNETERKKLMHELSKLEARIDNFLLVASNTDGYTEAFNDTFDSFQNIDTANTTAHVDLTNRQVTLPERENDFEKIDISNSIATVVCPLSEATSTTTDAVLNCLDDSINTAWRQRITVATSQDVTIYFDVKIADKPTTINEIAFYSYSPKQTLVEILWSNDGSSWEEFSQQSAKMTMGVATWNFDGQAISNLRFRLTKKEPDDYVDNRYVYTFGCKNISVYRVAFAEDATLVSTAFTTKREQISRVSLEVDHEIPTDTNIEYFLSPVIDGSETVFQPISHTNDANPVYPKVLDLSTVTINDPESFIPNVLDFYTVRGITFYKIKELSNVPLEGSTSLFRGIGQWRREHFFYIPKEDVAITPADYLPSLTDWSRLPASRDDYTSDANVVQITQRHITAAYIDVRNNLSYLPLDFTQTPVSKFNPTDGGFSPTSKGHYYLFTTCVYMEKATAAIKAQLKSSGCKVVVYVNRKEAKPLEPTISNNVKTCTISYELVKGWNIIQYVVYRDTDSVELMVDPGIQNVFDPAYSDKDYYLRAEIQPLVLTSKYNMENNVLNTDNEQFCVDGQSVIVNYNPKKYSIYDSTTATNFATRFAVQYSFCPDLNKIKAIQLMAVLSRGDSSDMITPKLLSYRIKAL